MPYTKQNTRVAQFSINTDFQGSSGTALNVFAVAHLESLLVNDADANDIIFPRNKIISFDLLDAATQAVNITAAGKTVTYPQLAALIRQACLDRATAQGIS